MKVRLNKRTIDEAVYEGPGGCYLWDTQQPGFGVRIYPSGSKSFVVSYWINGRRRFYTIGKYGRITLHQARESAMEVFLQVHRGRDPSGERRAANKAPTVSDLADRHISDHAKIKNKPRCSATSAPDSCGTAPCCRRSASARSGTYSEPTSPS